MANIYRTLGTSTNDKKGTISVWLKKASNGVNLAICNGNTNGTNYTQIYFDTNDNIFMYGQNGGAKVLEKVTSRKFRDNSAFYHIVCAWDTTQGSASDRWKLYVNGVQETSFSSDTTPASDQVFKFNVSGNTFKIGVNQGDANAYKGIMSHFQFVDGLQLAPTEFGEVDATSGIWKIKTGSYATAGTNGFHLKMEDSSNMDLDSSSNGHTFTTSGDVTATKDCPSINYTTMNPLLKSSYCTLSNGNTKTAGNSSSDTGNCSTTLLATTGLYYAEIKSGTIAGTTYPRVGVQHTPNTNYGRCVNGTDGGAGGAGTPNGIEGYACANGQKFTSNVLSSFASAWVATDILAVAMDCTNGAAYVAINNVWQNSGVPTSGASKTGALVTWTPADVDATAFASCDWDASSLEWNFGNGYFGSTAIGSPVSSGNGLWKYSPPTNYVSLNTKEINT